MRHLRLKPFLVRSIMLGVLMALFAGPFAIYIVSLAQMIAGNDTQFASEFTPPPTYTPPPTAIALQAFSILVLAPLLESLVFPLFYWLIRRAPGAQILFPLLIGVAAYFAHGGRVGNATQAASFILMALWYAHLRGRFPAPASSGLRKIPYYGVVIAHFCLNATVLLIAGMILVLASVTPCCLLL